MTKSDAINLVHTLPVEEQYTIARTLAANCGYKLVPEDDEESLKIKKLIEEIKTFHNVFTQYEIDLIINGLEALIK